MIKAIENNEYSNLALSKVDSNRELPRHRWYALKEGFSEALVAEAVARANPRSDRLRILDPFAGSGTTLVAAGRLGHDATGIEVNPFLAFASRIKCTPGDWDCKEFGRVVRDALDASKKAVRSPLEGTSTFTERPGLERWLFNRGLLRGFTAMQALLADTPRYGAPLRLALFASLMECCNAKRDGKCLRYRRDWKDHRKRPEDLRAAFSRRAAEMLEDANSSVFDHGGLLVLAGDARRELTGLEPERYDLVVTSPPYLNSFDYSDVYRPELFAGGFVRDNSQLRSIRLSTIRSHVQVGWNPSDTNASSLLTPLLEELDDKELWDKRLPSMVRSYFVDMALVLREAARATRQGGQAWIVVSTSAYGGVHLPVDLVLADVGTHNGWDLLGVYVLRSLRSAGQHWARQATRRKPPLRESLVILKRH